MGLYIVLEGPDGSGKTTLAQMVSESLQSDGFDVILQRQPTSFLNDQIRSILSGTPILQREQTLALLFAADRLQIQPPSESQILICDRDLLSSLVYQGSTLSMDWIMSVNKYHVPYDLQIVIHPQEGDQERRLQDRASREIYEVSPVGYATRYRSIQMSKTIHLDNYGTLESLRDRIIKHIKSLAGLPSLPS